ncbi:hypothetical protein ACFYXS_06265 [Streptomyces sp. NPDC002574]|uniref:hypothetical protein n=1 Tax=Streptomyces sp. NPDC002574 TaxID=3364652 RepID=UPI0036AE977D
MTARRTAHTVVLLYPPAWRARYGEEFRALLDDMRPGPRQLLDIAVGAAAAWVRPARRLHDRQARLRVSVTAALFAWTVLAAGAVLFAKITHDGAWSADGRTGSGAARWYDVFVFVCGASVVTLGLGMSPLLAAVPGAARAAGRLRGTLVLLAVPLVVPPTFLASVAAASALVGSGHGFGAVAFSVLAVLGVATALLCAAGPAAALARSRPREPSLAAAVVAGAGAVVLMAAATGAALMSELRGPGQGPTAVLTLYAAVMAAAVAIAAVSCLRGLASLRPSR